ncbi:hypothetical protein D3C84_568950 [compost metagenome]
MLVVQVEGFDAEPLEGAVDRGADVFRASVDPSGGRVRRIADDAELACQKHLITLAGDGFADQFFVGVRAVHVGGVEQVDAQFQRTMQGGRGFPGVRAGGVEISHAHAAQTDRADLRTVFTQLTCLHEISSL